MRGKHSRNDSSALRPVPAHRFGTADSSLQGIAETVDVAVESAVTIDVAGVDSYTLLCSPTDTEALAMGFLLSEGVIDSPEQVTELRPCHDDSSLWRVRLSELPPRIDDEGRNLLIVSSCGLCGAQSLEQKVAALPGVGDTLRIEAALLRTAAEALRDRQELFRASGGTHAVGLFDEAGALLSWAEDTGRHNALDKAIGKRLLAGSTCAGCGAVLSGRVSLEMVGKCARAGIELLSAVSAPTSLAIDTADRCNITLCAFVRQTRATVFSHPRRIRGMGD